MRKLPREVPDLRLLRRASDEQLAQLAAETANAPPGTTTRDLHRFASLLMDARGVLCAPARGLCSHPWSHAAWHCMPRAERALRIREIARELRAVERMLAPRAHRGRVVSSTESALDALAERGIISRPPHPERPPTLSRAELRRLADILGEASDSLASEDIIKDRGD